MNKNIKIDFILMWVDGNDPKWREDFNRYAPIDKNGDKNEVRFRDWDNLQYWFRSIEMYAPWVNKIHFVTYGHLPEWLDTNHPKLNIVLHEDIFEDQSCLPTFNSRAIEVNLHRIDGLSEHFVYFNDDTFLLQPTSKERFFLDGKPRDIAVSNVISPSNDLAHTLIDDIKIIGKYFNKKQTIKQNFFKWFNIVYGTKIFRTLFLLPWPDFTGFYDPHQPAAFLKSTYLEVWEKEREVLLNTSQTKFKKAGNVNQYLFRYWQLAKGTFEPIGVNDSLMIGLATEKDCQMAASYIRNQRFQLLCLNDSVDLCDFKKAKSIIAEAFEYTFASKSSYEK